MTEYNPRVAEVALDILDSARQVLDKHQVSHEEYRTAWAWVTGLAGSGEVPLFLDVFFEATVEHITNRDKPGSQGTVEGPYHRNGAPELTALPYVMPMRADEPGEPLVFTGTVVDLAGAPVPGALIDMWQAGNDGTYSGFVGDAPEMNLRCRMRADDTGRFEIRTIRPAPYQIPIAGPTGSFLEMVGRHAWRPAHFHFIVTADGFEALTTQTYFRGDPWLDGDGDVVGAVKDSLIIDVVDGDDPAVTSRYSLRSGYQAASYTFQLRPVTRS